MSESFRSRLYKLRFNFFPAYRRTGVRIIYVSHDLHEVRIRLSLKWNNKSHIGSIWGGSLYGSVDPVYSIMLSVILGKHYVAVDKKATIEFLKPGTATLYSTFKLSPDDVKKIKEECDSSGKTDRTYHVALTDERNDVYFKAEKVVHIMRRKFKTKNL